MKKIIAMLLSAAMLISVPSAISAEEYDTSTAEGRRDRNIDLFFDAIPVVTDDMTEDGKITRGEFAGIIKNILDRSGGISYGNETRFSDVDAETEYSEEIGLISSMGYMSGSGGRFRPEDTVTSTEAAEAMVHLLRADYILGAASDLTSGVWQAMDMANVDVSAYSGEDNASWIKLLVYKSLNGNIGVESGTNNGHPQMSIDNSVTYIEKYWEMKRVNGLLSANSLIEISGKNPAGDNMVTIDGVNYVSYLMYENSAYIGQYVTAFISDRGVNDNRVMCMFPNEQYEPSVTVNSRDIDGLDSLSKFTAYDENGRKKSYSISSLAHVYFNFEYMGPVRALDYGSDKIKAVLEAVNSGKSCEIYLADSDRDGKYDFVWIRQYENYPVSKFTYDEYSIEDKYGQKLDLDSAFRLNDVVLFDGEGGQADAAAIQENDVLSLITAYDDDGVISKALGYLSRNTVSGEMTGVSGEVCTINGGEYYVTSRYEALAAQNNRNVLVLKPGLITTFYLNQFNEIAAVSFTDYYKEGESYAFIIAATYDPGEEKTILKLLSEEGEIGNEYITDSVSINGSKCTGEGIIKAMSSISGESISSNVCNVYRLARVTRTNNEIKKIQLAYTSVRPEGTSADDLYPDQILYSQGSNTDGTSVTIADVVYKSNTFGKRVGITTSSVIFDVPIKAKNAPRVTDSNAYTMTSVSNMQDDCVLGLGGVKKVGAEGGGAYMEFFDCDSTLFASAAVRYYAYDETVGGVATPPEMQGDCLIVSKVYSEAVNEEGENVILIEGYKAGAKVSYETAPIRDPEDPWGQFTTLTDPDKGAKLERRDGSVITPEMVSETGVLPGDVLQLTMDGNNKISNILINIRGGEEETAAWLMTNGNGTTTSILSAASGHGNEYLGVNYGKVTEIQSGKVVLDELDGKKRVYSIGSPTITVFNRTLSKNNVRKGSTDDIEIGKDIYIRQYYSQVKEIVVFED